MSHLPVIVGFGGINSAGRASNHYAYRRLVIESLNQADADETLINLAVLMGLIKKTGGTDNKWLDTQGNAIELGEFLTFHRELILSSTLIRKLENNLFDNSKLFQTNHAVLSPIEGETLSFTLATRKLPENIPGNWQVTALNEKLSKIEVTGNLEAMLPDSYKGAVNSAGQLPTGFNPAELYPSRNHPRSLQMTVYGASDAILSMGIDWETIKAHVNPDQIAVYAGSGMSQLDYNGNAGMLQARLLGKRVTSKQLPLGFAEMPADFINAYMLGNIGKTACNLGACATFLYNLNQAIRDIQSGTHRVAIVGNSEAPLVPEIFEGYSAMGALADDEKLSALDKLSAPNHRRACRPFAENVGFTLAESAQFIVLFDDALAMQLGANIHGSVNDVFVNADGHKKSIASPGIGNYLTVAKAAAATKAVLGEEALCHKTFVQAHGTGTPQNRVTESAILDNVAAHFGIENWPVTAVKSYIGHSIASAGADQLTSSLGVWKYGLIPGILSSQTIADDVHKQHLDFLLEHKQIETSAMEAVILNAKGFGGNNATASVLSPTITKKMLARKHGAKAFAAYQTKNELIIEASAAYEDLSNSQAITPIYKFDHNVCTGDDVKFEGNNIKITGQKLNINLQLSNPYEDMCD
jgi:acetoacetyl-[acyl-carrier protein] synthase